MQDTPPLSSETPKAPIEKAYDITKGATVDDFLKVIEDLKGDISDFVRTNLNPWYLIVLDWPKAGVPAKDIMRAMQKLLEFKIPLHLDEANALVHIVAGAWFKYINDAHTLFEAIKLLINAGAEIDAKNVLKKSLIEVILDWPLFTPATFDQVIEIIKALKALSADSTLTEHDNLAVLHAVFRIWPTYSTTRDKNLSAEHIRTVLDILPPSVVGVDGQDSKIGNLVYRVCDDWVHNKNPLSFELIRDTIRLLLERKVSLRCVDPEAVQSEVANTPLIRICERGNLSSAQAFEIVQLMLQHDPDLLKAENEGTYFRPLQRVVEGWCEGVVQSEEAQQSLFTQVQYFVEQGADPSKLEEKDFDLSLAESVAYNWNKNKFDTKIMLAAIKFLVSTFEPTQRTAVLNKVALIVGNNWRENNDNATQTLEAIKDLVVAGAVLEEASNDISGNLINVVVDVWVGRGLSITFINEAIQYLLAQNVSTTMVSPVTKSLPLDSICKTCCPPQVRPEEFEQSIGLFLSRPEEAKVSLASRNEEQLTPLLVLGKQWLKRDNSIEQMFRLTQQMVDCGADGAAVDKDNKNLLSYFIEEWAFLPVLKGQHLDVLDRLLKLSPALELTISHDKSFPISNRAAIDAQWRTGAQAMSVKRQSVKSEDYELTPLEDLASTWMNLNTVDIGTVIASFTRLIEHELRLLNEQRNGDNFKAKVVYQLMLKNYQGCTPLLSFFIYCLPHLKANNYPAFRNLLVLCLDHGNDVNAQSISGNTIMHYLLHNIFESLTEENRMDLLELLTKYEVDLTLENPEGVSVLFKAASICSEKEFSYLNSTISDEQFAKMAVNPKGERSLFAAIGRNGKMGTGIWIAFMSRVLKTVKDFEYQTNENCADVWKNLNYYYSLRAKVKRPGYSVQVFEPDAVVSFNRQLQGLIREEGTSEQLYYFGQFVHNHICRDTEAAGSVFVTLLTRIFTDQTFPPTEEQRRILSEIMILPYLKSFTPAEQQALRMLWNLSDEAGTPQGSATSVEQGLGKLARLVDSPKTRPQSIIPCLVLARHYEQSADTREKAFHYYEIACGLSGADDFPKACCAFANARVQKMADEKHVPAMLVMARVKWKEENVNDAYDYCGQFLLHDLNNLPGQQEAISLLMTMATTKPYLKSLELSRIVRIVVRLLLHKRTETSVIHSLLHVYGLSKLFSAKPFEAAPAQKQSNAFFTFFKQVFDFGSDGAEFDLTAPSAYLVLLDYTQQEFDLLVERIQSGQTTPKDKIIIDFADEFAKATENNCLTFPQALITDKLKTRVAQIRSTPPALSLLTPEVSNTRNEKWF